MMNDAIKSAVGRTSECPSLDALVEAPRNPGIQSHLDSCAFCRSELALFHDFEAAAPQAGETASVEWIVRELGRRGNANQVSTENSSLWDRIRGWFELSIGSNRRAFAMAAMSLLVVLAGGVYWEYGRASIPGEAFKAPVWRAGRFAAIAPLGDIAQSPGELRWERLDGAAAYEIELRQVDSTLVWQTRSEDPAVEIPDNIRAQLKPGRAFQWRVIGRDPAGEQIGTTDLQFFHILAKTP